MLPVKNSSLALLAVFAFLGGCTSPPETKYYTLRPTELPVVKASPSPDGRTKPILLVDRFAIDEAYATQRIAYRESSHELNYDPYSLWAGPPAAQVEDAVRDLAFASGLFSEVFQPSLNSSRADVDFILTGRIARLEEIDEDDDHWKAALDLELYLLDARKHDVISSGRFPGTATAAKRNPREVVAAISVMLDKAVKDFFAGSTNAMEVRRRRGP
jgi:ABC-type uncharacterized transport system auxiliary subunit